MAIIQMLVACIVYRHAVNPAGGGAGAGALGKRRQR
jgi:hypothetical protein